MKNEEISTMTKKKLAESLKKQMKKKSLSKITISDIVKDCDVNRKTFYYHFIGIEELFKWMLEEEAVHVVKNFDVKKDYKEAILFVMDYIESNQDILNCAYDSIGREGLKDFFYDDFYEVVLKVIETTEDDMDIAPDPDFKDFLCKMYAGAIANMIIDYFYSRKHVDHEKIANYIALIVSSSIKSSIEEYKRNVFDVEKYLQKKMELG